MGTSRTVSANWWTYAGGGGGGSGSDDEDRVARVYVK